MLLTNKKVAIIGAGPVGLTMARLLQQKGVGVSVYERDKDPEARVWGGTLDLHESTGQEAMKAAGLLTQYFAMAKPMGRTITDEQGKVLFSVPPANDTPEINRNDLRTMLLNSLAGDTVVWDRKFTGYEERGGKWLLHFSNGIDAAADIVIVANGGMSQARVYVTDAEVEDSGTTIIQAEVYEAEIKCPEFYKLCGNNILMTAGKGISLVANPDNNGALTYAVTFKTPDEWADGQGPDFKDTDSIIAFLENRMYEWDECYQQLFRSTSFFVGLPTRKLPLDKPWKTERPLPVTLIGDAAHLMPPFAGQGVNIGLVDAMILADKLTNGPYETIATAISAYEQEMLVYARAAQEETRRNETAMHVAGFSFRRRFDS